MSYLCQLRKKHVFNIGKKIYDNNSLYPNNTYSKTFSSHFKIRNERYVNFSQSHIVNGKFVNF